MRRVFLGQKTADDNQAFRKWAEQALREIESASEDDIADVFGDFTVTGFTNTRSLNATTATLSDVASFLCTLVNDLSNRGSKRNQ